MHITVNNLIAIQNLLKKKNISQVTPKIIAVSKTFPASKILPLINHGHIHFGENKIQESIDKWSDLKKQFTDLKLHMVGKLQTNKVKFAVKLFDYIHSVDTEKLARKIADEEIKQNKKVKIFIQVNIGNEKQKSGVNKNKLEDLFFYCKNLNLDVIGLMCIPPAGENTEEYFKETKILNQKLDLLELSMGMSSDYIKAIKYSSTYLRIGSSIFGNRV
ncbi:YggS family pyridoxal phosphate-dependent enzyme [Candidatus Pelagibacter sp.]|nr:YggS family pyridoxal phosphate-dependent enzyme [Candidatus Pelagibacter sp.]